MLRADANMVIRVGRSSYSTRPGYAGSKSNQEMPVSSRYSISAALWCSKASNLWHRSEERMENPLVHDENGIKAMHYLLRSATSSGTLSSSVLSLY